MRLALVDPNVKCFPMVRPGLSMYSRHGGVINLIAEHARRVWGLSNRDQQHRRRRREVTIQARILHEPGYGPLSLSVTTVFTFQNGLITIIESEPSPQRAMSPHIAAVDAQSIIMSPG
jgi:hypothetical protein